LANIKWWWCFGLWLASKELLLSWNTTRYDSIREKKKTPLVVMTQPA
jgi:hypothetical protein